MKKLIYIVSIVFCAVALIFSYASWNAKLSAARKSTAQTTGPSTATAEDKTEDAVSTESAEIDLDLLTANMDEPVQALFQNREQQGDKLQLLIVGSDSMESGGPGYVELLAEALDEFYAGFVETEIMSFDGTSEEFLASRPNLSAGYDVVLMEPFTLKNNGRVEIETEHLHIQNVFGEILSETDDAVLVLHPPQPIYGAQFYRTQVTALEEFAGLRNYAYIDHWEEWPSTEDLTLKEYLTEDSNPNNSGAETWANALIAYFTGS